MKLILALASLALVGCSTTQTMSMNDLDYFKPDCSRRDEQLRWLASQYPSQTDYVKAHMSTTSLEGVLWTKADGTFEQKQVVASGRYQMVILAHMDYLKRHCPTPRPRPAGCVTVREDMDSGSAVGKRCQNGRDPRPVINRWDPLVDK